MLLALGKVRGSMESMENEHENRFRSENPTGFHAVIRQDFELREYASTNRSHRNSLYGQVWLCLSATKNTMGMPVLYVVNMIAP